MAESGVVLLEAVLADDTPASSSMPAKDKGSWSELTSAEQGAASGLGWDGEMWDLGDTPTAVDCDWAALGSERQALAALLGYDEIEWGVEHAAHSPGTFVDAEQGRRAGSGRRVAREQAVAARLQERNLPAGWKAAASKRTGSTYYYNKGTGEKSFTRPQENG